MSTNRVAIITGGASGMGLAVAQTLSIQGGWDIHILDLNTESGESTARSLGPNATFHKCNVTSYDSLGSIFNTIYTQSSRLDFVFANAGIAEHGNFFAPKAADCDGIPPPPKGMNALVDINIKSVITTCHLALHYMRHDKTPGRDKNLIITASCGGFYPSYYSPIYTATKHAVVGFMRAIAPYFHHSASIRVNAICPGTVRTNLLSNAEWEQFPEEYFTPVEKIAQTVAMLIGGEDKEKGGDQGVLLGKAVEVSGWKHYYRDAPEFSDEAMRAVMGATNIEVSGNAEEVKG
ncbi:hypothetical protein BCR34DRAFT_666720 [Clohesyomyces aquaticus]|uniref:NAD(P)-binding protein n=1 Tax=Clohesyomyces aquaticus TaxID=1231657 RepID=A0A1Y1Z7R2_9PLEO|nr:hypothetical protein BCR34DRAFT_666720 [Clohesyomyces aquaticus]